MSLDYGLSEEQQMFRDALRSFLASEWSAEEMKRAWDHKTDYPLRIYRKMGELGWLGLIIPERYGGMGLGWIEIAILFEELGRALLKGPFIGSMVLGAQAVLLSGSEAQKQELLPRIAAGDIILAWADVEAGVSHDLQLVTTKATVQDGYFSLVGQKLFVTNMRWANYVMTVARLEGGAQQDRGLGIFLVDTASNGLTYRLMDGIDGEQLAEVNYDKVVVAEKYLLGTVGADELANILENCKIAYSAEMVGGAERALELSIAYGNTRYQFGRLIGSFQAIQHKLATVAMLIERSRWLTYYAAYLSTQGIDCRAERNMAYLAAGEAYRLASAEGVQIHGGSGCMRIHEVGRHFQRAKALQLKLEPAYVSREKIAQVLEEKGAKYGVQIY
jgi:alkylation response protein AidB-like acyl-CoA dehydrogenase